VVFLFRPDFLPSKKSVAMPKAISGGRESSVETLPLYSPEKKAGERVTQETIRGGAASDSAPIISRNKKNVAVERPAGVKVDAQRKTVDPRKPLRETARDHPIRGAASAEQAIAPTPAETKTVDIGPPIANRLYNVSELPLQVRQNLPDFSVSVFIYSDEPASRLVRINGQMMREGQNLTSGVKLEEIVPSGVIFSCQRYRFLIAPK
jgi:hypothetical protein